MAEIQTRADASREVNDVRTVAHAWIPMADGTRLSAKLWLPDPPPPGGVPVILEYAPYRKDDATSAGDERMFGYFAARGYACVRVDIRGCGDSDGILEGEYLALEQDDALEVLAWIAAQPWSDGGVGMAETIEILGVARLDVAVTSDQPNALLAVRLCDVAPDGSSTLVTRRVLNLTHRESHEHPSPLVPDEAVTVTVALTAIAHSFPPGHRIRLAVSPTYWPWAWPSPVTAELTFALQECVLELPVRPRPALEPAIAFAEPEWAPALEVVSYSATPSRRIISSDVGAGRLTIATDFSYFGDQAYRNGLEYREDMRDVESIVVGDPLSAEVRCERTIRMRQREWNVRVHAWATMSSTIDAFVVTNGIDAYEDEVRVAAKRWSRQIPRDLV
jgi:hypothetical protein